MTARARVCQADLARIFRAAKKAGVRASVTIGEGADAIRIEALADGVKPEAEYDPIEKGIANYAKGRRRAAA